MTSFVRSKILVEFCASCLFVCFDFGLAQFTQMLLSFSHWADEEKSSENADPAVSSSIFVGAEREELISENALSCPAQSPRGVREPRGKFVKFACLGVLA